MSQSSVDLSSLPCGSSVDGSFRIQRKPIRLMEDSKELALYLENPRLRNFISSYTHCDNSIRDGRVGIPDFPFSLIPNGSGHSEQGELMADLNRGLAR